MDTSETYIKMCDCPEIQKLWTPVNGDFCWHGNEGEEAFGSWEFPSQVSVVHISQETDKDWWYNWLWLPRQDQLQAMVWEGSNTRSMVMQFADWLEYETNYRRESMEQLWLVFVMFELHSKRWGGERWLIKDTS